MSYRIIRRLLAYAPLVQPRSERRREDEMGLEQEETPVRREEMDAL